MVRSRVLLSAILTTLGVALAGCAAPSLPPGYYVSGDPPGTSEIYCGQWQVVPTACVDARAVYQPTRRTRRKFAAE